MNNSDIDLIINLELELLKIENRKSSDMFKKYLSEDFIELAQDGKKYNKQEIIEIIPKSHEENIIASNIETKIICENTILLIYKIDREFVLSKEKRKTHCSSIWQKKDDKLQMIFFQGTNVN